MGENICLVNGLKKILKQDVKKYNEKNIHNKIYILG